VGNFNQKFPTFVLNNIIQVNNNFYYNFSAVLVKNSCSILIFILFILPSAGTCQEYIPGKTYFGHRDFISYQSGNLPFILAAAHGGNLKPNDLPDRSCSGCSYTLDAYTIELTMEIAAAIHHKTGCYPHVIINHLHRIKLDANRDVTEAALGNQEAERAWSDFHRFIDASKSQINKNSGKGLFLDIHGHGHTIQRIELGYLLYDDELRLPDHVLNSAEYVGYSSIRNLVMDNKQQLNHSELLRGNSSFGQYFGFKGFPAVPSYDIPFPLASHPYFSGGYNTARHGSWRGGVIDGIQVECNQQVRFNDSERKKFAADFAEVILQYVEAHYFDNFSEIQCLSSVHNNGGSFNSRIQAIPNPVIAETRLFIREQHNVLNIKITDITGKIVSVFSSPGDIINLEHLLPGFYMLEANTGKDLYSVKIIKL
jgi:hypothetical protein